MLNQNNQALTRVVEVVNKNNSGVIVLPANVTVDSAAAGTALYLALSQLNKNVTIACQSKVNFDLTAASSIQTKLVTGGDNLVISLPYIDGSIDKVDYNIEGEHFNLIISPRAGFQKFKPDQVKFNYTGGSFNFLIVLDTPTLNSLGALYTDHKEQFQGHEIINIDRHLTNTNFGTVNFVEKSSSSVSELVLDLIRSLNIEIDRDIATNLYAGIAAATNNFTSYSVNASTFEAVAFLLRKGALKKLLKKPQAPAEFPPANYPPSFSAAKTANIAQIQNKRPQQFRPQTPTPVRQDQTITPIEEVEQEQNEDDVNPPTDWLKPKIFRGGGLI